MTGSLTMEQTFQKTQTGKNHLSLIDMNYQRSTASHRHKEMQQTKIMTKPEKQQQFSGSKSRSTIATSKRFGRADFVRSMGEVHQSDQ